MNRGMEKPKNETLPPGRPVSCLHDRAGMGAILVELAREPHDVGGHEWRDHGDIIYMSECCGLRAVHAHPVFSILGAGKGAYVAAQA
ncbi:hypothetical protein JCM25156A_03580 [Komagataeibacter kakiaceti JCM 25156]